MKQFKADKLTVSVFETREQMGNAASIDIRNKIDALLSVRDEINIIFAATPSQNDVLSSLISNGGIEWQRINAFHMDEYLGLSLNAPQSFRSYLKSHLFDHIPLKSVNLINSQASCIKAEVQRYSSLIKENKPDIVIMGIGENGHIAFNDPPVADFNDEMIIKSVKLDDVC